MFKQVAVALIGFLSGGVASVLAHRPQASTIHRRLDATCIWILAGVAELLRRIPITQVFGGVERLHLDLGAGGEGGLAFGRALDGAAVGRRAPLLGARADRWICWLYWLLPIRLRGLLCRLTLHRIAHGITLGSVIFAMTLASWRQRSTHATVAAIAERGLSGGFLAYGVISAIE